MTSRISARVFCGQPRNRLIRVITWRPASAALALRTTALAAATLLTSLFACDAPDYEPDANAARTPQLAPPPTGQASPAVRSFRLLSLFEMAKAEGLLYDRLPCLGCHRLDDKGGRIGPSLTGLGDRASFAYVKAVIADPEAMLPGTIMPRVPMTSAMLDLIARYLIQQKGGTADTVPPIVPPPRVPMAGAKPRPAAVLYAAYCAACHGPTGRGDGYNVPYLPERPTVHADSSAMSRRPDDTLFDAIYAGGRIVGRSHRMPPFGESLRRAEIRSLVSHIRELCGCQGPSWSRDGAPFAP